MRQASFGGHHLQLPGGPHSPGMDKWAGGVEVRATLFEAGAGRTRRQVGEGATAVIAPTLAPLKGPTSIILGLTFFHISDFLSCVTFG